MNLQDIDYKWFNLYTEQTKGVKNMKKNIAPTSIRISEELYNKIKDDADKEKRSITKQIEFMLEKYYEIKDRIK